MSETITLSEKVLSFLNNPKQLFINGDFVDSVSGKTFETYNPANGEVLANVSEADTEDVNKAVASAKKAFEDGPWSKMSSAERGHLMYKLSMLIEEHQQEIAEIDALDNGKPIHEVLGNDIPNAIGQFRYFAGWTTKMVGETI